MRYVHYSSRREPPEVPLHTQHFGSGANPLGVYTYQEDAEVVTYASKRPYIFVLEPTVRVLYTDRYSQEELDRDLRRLTERGVDVETALMRWQKYRHRFRESNPNFAFLWYVVTKAKRTDDPDEMPVSWGAPGTYDPAYARELMVGLGHEVVDDRRGMIYSSEPEQAVFFTDRSFRVIGSREATVVQNPRISRRHASPRFVRNPGWATDVISKSFATLQDNVKASWLPRLADVEPLSDDLVMAQLKEYGCGTYGCVYPTLDPEIVLKVTTDDTEADFASRFAATLPSPICVRYHLVIRLAEKHKNRNIYLLWRESAQQVGKIETLLGPAAYDLVQAQWEAAKIVYRAMFETSNERTIESKIDEWLATCHVMASQQEVPELRAVGQGLIDAYQFQGIFFGDVHIGNLGVVAREDGGHWVITDPGNIAVINDERT